MTQCYEQYLSGESKIISKKSGICDSFDLFIFTIGWESRCSTVVNYSKKGFNFNTAILLSFSVDDVKGYKEENYIKINNFVYRNLKKENIFPIENDPTKLDLITDEIDNVLQNLVKKFNRPLNIGIDISSCPRYFFLYLLSFCLKNNISKKISFFYSEGTYKTNIEEYMHTNGIWSIIEIPNFNGTLDPEYKDLYVISAGFEAKRCKSIINKYEPDKIGILLPNPGFNHEYTKKACDQCDMLRNEFSIPNDYIIAAPASDAIAAWSELKKSRFTNDKYNVTYVTIGPKPHILAMGIHGFLNNSIITYRIPESYTKIDVESNDVYWQYDVHNLIF